MVYSFAVDIDGVLADYSDGWNGPEHFGIVIEGAREFLKNLCDLAHSIPVVGGAEILIYSTRGSASFNEEYSPLQLKTYIQNWLEENELYYDDIYVGVGKPPAMFYFDDRAVMVRPMENPKAFEEATKFATEEVAKFISGK